MVAGYSYLSQSPLLSNLLVHGRSHLSQSSFPTILTLFPLFSPVSSLLLPYSFDPWSYVSFITPNQPLPIFLTYSSINANPAPITGRSCKKFVLFFAIHFPPQTNDYCHVHHLKILNILKIWDEHLEFLQQ